jgi:hypothetical protein
MITPTTSNTDISKHYFPGFPDKPIDTDANKFACSDCGAHIKQLKSAGSTNLVNHVRGSHRDYQDSINLHKRDTERGGNIGPFRGFLNSKAINIYSWMEWIVETRKEEAR